MPPAPLPPTLYPHVPLLPEDADGRREWSPRNPGPGTMPPGIPEPSILKAGGHAGSRRDPAAPSPGRRGSPGAGAVHGLEISEAGLWPRGCGFESRGMGPVGSSARCPYTHAHRVLLPRLAASACGWGLRAWGSQRLTRLGQSLSSANLTSFPGQEWGGVGRS